MTSDDPEQAPSSLADISEEKIIGIATKIWENKDLNADDRQTIFFALMGEWEPLSLFRKPQGRRNTAFRHKALAEDVERLKSEGQVIKDHMASLGEKHQLPGLEDVSRDTFNKCLKRGRDSQDKYKRFKINVENRKRKKNQGDV